MWILIKIIIAIIALLVRLFRKLVKLNFGAKLQKVEGIDLYINTFAKKQNNASATQTSFSTSFKCNAIFKLTKESSVDKFFKTLGLANEIQTQDQKFDQRIYVACDSYSFRQELIQDSDARQMILNLFDNGANAITCDGENLVARFFGDKQNETTLQETFAKFSKQIIDIKQSIHGLFPDPFAFKILATEALIWFLGGYAVSNFLEYKLVADQVHLNAFSLLWQGLILGFVFAAAIFGLIILFLKGSSRGHRILVESFIVLLLSLPVGGVGVISDINKELDKSPSLKLNAKVVHLYSKKHRGRKGSTYYTYHLTVEIKDNQSGFVIPTNIKLSYDTYLSLQPAKYVDLEIGKGRLGHPWFRSIEPTSGW